MNMHVQERGHKWSGGLGYGCISQCKVDLLKWAKIKF